MSWERWGREAGSVGTGTVLVTLGYNGFKARGRWEGNQKALLVFGALKKGVGGGEGSQLT